MPASSAHLKSELLEQLAEDSLPRGELAEARSHLEACRRCSAEFEAFQSLFAALGELPRYAPASGFEDAVMARVQIAPQESHVLAWLKRLMPSSRRGWAMVSVAAAAPAIPIIAMIAWLLSQPLLSPLTLWQWGVLRTQSISQATFAWLVDQTIGSGLFGWAEASYATIQAIPVGALGGALGALAVAIPLSAWGLVRLTRKPVGSVTYAN